MLGIALFAGAGGMSLGARWAGVRVVAAVERDINAAKTFARNTPGAHVLARDIRTVVRADFAKEVHSRREPLVIFGGPPCQGFSYSNQRTRNAENMSNWLLLDFLRIVSSLRPEWVVFENVTGFPTTAGGRFLDTLQSRLMRYGYSFVHADLQAATWGVPQRRTRFVLVASTTDSPQVPLPLKQTRLVTVGQAIRDLPQLPNGFNGDWMPYRSKARSAFARRMRGQLSGSHNHLVTRNAAYVIQRYEFVPPGGNWEDIPKRRMRNYADPDSCHTGIYHRLRLDAPSVVLGNFRKNMLIHPGQDRGLSVREAARLQSFPDWYRFEGSIGFQQQQVANAVPPILAKAVFGELFSAQKVGRNA